MFDSCIKHSRCQISDCAEVNCKTIVKCRDMIHYKCKCQEEENEIPAEKLKFVKRHRERAGTDDSYNDNFLHKFKKKKDATDLDETDGEDDNNDNENPGDPYDPAFSPGFDEAMKNYQDFFNFGLQGVKLAGRVSKYELAQLATALLIDLKIVTPDNQDLIIDSSKMGRILKKVGEKVKEDARQSIKDNPPLCFGFDGKKDTVNFYNVINDVKHPDALIEEHIVMTLEPGSRMMDFFTHQGKATVLGDKLYDKLVEHKAVDSVAGIKADSCPTNTGWEHGCIQHLEKRIDRPLLWNICDCHTTELPLHHLIKDKTMSGATTSGGTWKCPVMKQLNTVLDKEITVDFEPIVVGPGIQPVSEEVLKSLSEDQQFAYKICNVVRTGQGLETVDHYKTGVPFLSRWYTIANRLCILWITADKHQLSPEHLQKLRIYVEFITGWYLPVHFYIKQNPSYLDGPDHLLYAVQLLKYQRPEVLAIVWPTVVRGAFYGNSENILTKKLTSKDVESRKFAVDMTLQIRNGSDYGHNKFRVRNCPEKQKYLNRDATKIEDLINWTTPKPTESPLTVNMSTAEILKLLETPLQAPDLGDSHTQGVERLIQKVSKASRVVFSPEKLESVVRCSEMCSDLVRSSSSRTKRDLSNLLNSKIDQIMKK